MKKSHSETILLVSLVQGQCFSDFLLYEKHTVVPSEKVTVSN